MGEAMIVRRGGGGAARLVVLNAPRTSYYAGERIDAQGLLVGADFGTYVLPLDLSALTVTPGRALTTADRKMTAAAVIGPRTLTVDIPITVKNFSRTLNSNTWAEIGRAAALGFAADLWNVGDVKYTDYNGSSVGFRIIGFGVDDLDPTDARYNDTAYNGGSNKAAITFQAMWINPNSCFNANSMNISGITTDWLACRMRLAYLPGDLEALGDDVKNVVRTVTKITNGAATEERLFLPNRSEYEGENAYPYYAGGGQIPYNTYLPNQTRVCVWTRDRATSTFVAIDGYQRFVTSFEESLVEPYYPAFCV